MHVQKPGGFRKRYRRRIRYDRLTTRDTEDFSMHPTSHSITRVLALACSACAVTGAPAMAATPAAPGGPYDGNWQTTLSCGPARDALGYSYRFVSTVGGSQLHGAYGVQGQGGSLALTGTIGPDGNATLYAQGLTGSREFVPGRDTPRGTQYGYTLQSRFGATTGTGTRVEGRPCSAQFVRQ
jgi:hypothetical protein